MFLYSEKIMQFIFEVKFLAKAILSKELHLKITSDRFLNAEQNCSFPINIVIYNDRNMLGYFDANFCEMGFHEKLMYVDKKHLNNVIRHEIAHYITFIKYGYPVTPHGIEFRAFCKQHGWGEDVYSATVNVNEDSSIASLEESDVFRKIQKLMALSTSSNKHEAELAMIKSQQLLLKHNIDSKYMGSEEEKMVLKRIMKQPQKNARMQAIGCILPSFFVNVVFSRGQDGTYLEILGTEVNVQIAEYVAVSLQDKLDNLWIQTKKEHDLKGALAKNSFFLGVAKGYCNKIQSLKKSYSSDEANALMVIEGKLTRAVEMAYKRLCFSKNLSRYNREAALLGELAGKQLNINPGVGKSSTSSDFFISYQK